MIPPPGRKLGKTTGRESSMRAPKPTTRFRELIARRQSPVIPSVGDAFSARLIAHEGYDALMSSGNASSAMKLGMPDVGIMTLAENAAERRADGAGERASRLCRRRHRLWQCAERAPHDHGIRARRRRRHHDRGSGRPQTLRHAGRQARRLAEEMEGKVKAAVDARNDDDFVICARTDARAVEGGRPPSSAGSSISAPGRT